MTITEMDLVIQAHCSECDCGECKIFNLCNEVNGDFEGNETICKTAYEIIKGLSDSVNHPSHYNQGKFECIDVMFETFGKEATKNFCLLNAFKYIWRTGEKNGAEDVKKAVWYLNKVLELEGESND